MIYRREIDGLRALAVLPVILFHADIPGFSGGYIGVDVFFVISGYLITTILLGDFERGDFSLGRFYERRARRILPALFTVLAATTLAAVVVLSPRQLVSFSESLGAVLIFASNIFFYRESGYFSDAAALKPLLHTWSLAVEEQFYLFFPIVLAVIHKYRAGALRIVILALFAASFAFAFWQVGRDADAAFFLLPSRGRELMLGALCAVALIRRPPQHTGPLAELAGLAGIAMIIGAAVTFSSATPGPGVPTLLPTLGAALIILFCGADTPAGRLLGSAPAVGIGLVSYSAYLWHQPLLAFAHHLAPNGPTLAVRGALALSSLGLAYLTWRHIETPFRDRTRQPFRRVRRTLIAGAALLFVTGLGVHLAGGFPGLKLTATQQALMATAEPSPMRSQCHASERNLIAPEDACTYLGGDQAIAALGDSEMVELAYGLAQTAQPDGIAVKHLTFSGCYPAYARPSEGSRPECEAWTNEAVAWLDANPAIKTVVVSYRITTAFGDLTTPEQDLRWQSYIGLLEHLAGSGRKVVLVVQPPELPLHIEDLIETAPEGGAVAGLSRAEWESRLAAFTARIAELPPEVRIVDPADLFCDAQLCFAAKGGVSFYFDDNHLSVAGARLLARSIMRRLDR